MKRILYFDIEVYTDFKKEFKDMFNDGDNEIISIQIYDSYKKRYILLIKREDFEESGFKKYINGVSDTKIKYFEYRFKTEKDLLSFFIKYIRNVDPDIYSGFNINKFDFPYLFKRMKKLNLNGNLLSNLGVAYFYQKREETIIKGSIILDIMEMIGGFLGNQKDGMSLDSLSMKFLNFGKLTIDSKIMLDWYYSDIQKFIQYSMIDVQLCLMLDKKLGLIDMANSIIEFSSTIPKHVYKSGKCVESLMFALRDDNYIYDDNLDLDVSGVPGARVFDNESGLFYDYGAVIDFKRLYPNLIKSYNISPETIFIYNKNLYNENDYILTPNKDYMLLKNKKGLFPSIVDKLFGIRDMYEKKMKETDKNSDIYDAIKRQRQNAKDRVNTISGLFDTKFSRFKSIPCASAIRLSGRYWLEFIRNVAIKNGYVVRYGDTDSIFPKSKIAYVNGSKEEILMVLKDMELLVNIINDEINKKFGYENTIEVDLEKIYDVYVSVGVKKKYIMHKVYEGGEFIDKMYASGFEIKRSDSSNYSNNVQKILFEAISHRKSKEEIQILCRNMVKDFMKENIYDIAIPKHIRMNISSYRITNPWIEGSLYSNKYLNTSFDVGSIPRLLYMNKDFKPKGIPSTEAICIELNTNIDIFKNKKLVKLDLKKLKLNKKFLKNINVIKIKNDFIYYYKEFYEIDWDKMIDKNIIDKIDDILKMLNIDINYIKKGKIQTNMFDFFKKI